MIKYYKELENPNNFCLSLIERKDGPIGYKKVKKNDLPSDFFGKYSHLLRTIQDIDLLIRSINIDKISEKLRIKWNSNESSEIDYNLYQADYMTLNELEEMKEDIPRLKAILEVPTDIIPQLLFYSRALSLVMYLCPEIEDKWLKISLLFDSALKDIKIHSTIEYEEPTIVARNINLPNAWYITSYGDLYNTGGRNGHKETNLIYPYERVKRLFLEGKSIEGNKDALLKKRLEIINNGYISKGDFMNYLNYIYDFSSIQTTDNHSFLDARTYNLKLVKTILGAVSANAGFYHFFEDMQKYTLNPKRELYKLKAMTNNQISDILVRCSGFSKIESVVKKTITTSSLTPFEDLYEYIVRGWDVCVIPPIIVSREEGIVKELDTSSPIVERYIEHDTNKYEKCKQKRYGKLY
ncbi:MAG: hypothetical protein ACM3O4_01680 [Ignavibacteriales bacterium]